MILAFTGTRRGTTPAQLLAAFNLITAELPEQLLHGGAIGADTEIDELAAAFFWDHESTGGLLPIISVYPAGTKEYDYWLNVTLFGAIRKVHKPQAPLTRNRAMVKLCDHLIACPAEQTGEVLRSGTWYTVRAARKAGKPVTIVRPDGTVHAG